MPFHRLAQLACVCSALLLSGCGTPSAETRYTSSETQYDAPQPRTSHARRERAAESRQRGVPAALNLRQMHVPPGRFGRRIEFRLRPRYITVHSTANRGGTALQHAYGMQRGAFRGRTKWNRTGYMTWHFTVDDRVAIQHLPLNIQGEHADHDGPGNQQSIAIEICEFRDRARQAAAIDRAARLVAWLRRKHRIPIARVVPHHHWPQHRFGSYQKPCPRILLDGGRPGAKWAAFLRRVERL